jgi:transcriptional regulator with XRE-family HTH domain
MDTRAMLDIREVGRRIRERREQLRLDQQALADRALMSRPYISRLERGIVPAPKVTELAQVAAALDMTIVELLRHPPGTHTERYSTVCSELVQQLAEEPPEIADAVLQAFRQTMEIARVRHQSTHT